MDTYGRESFVSTKISPVYSKTFTKCSAVVSGVCELVTAISWPLTLPLKLQLTLGHKVDLGMDKKREDLLCPG